MHLVAVGGSDAAAERCARRHPGTDLDAVAGHIAEWNRCLVFVVEVPLRTERLILRPFATDDLDALHAIRSHPDAMRFLGGKPWTRAETAEQLARLVECDRLSAQGESLRLAIERRAAPGLIGSVSLRWVSAADKRGEIGFVVHPSHQGHGFATEAAGGMLQLAFERLRLHRVVAGADPRNRASVAVLRRLRMQQEACLRHHTWLNDEWADELIFGMLAEEWSRWTAPTTRA